MSSTKQQPQPRRVEVHPSELVFDLSGSSAPLKAVLRISNPHSDRHLVFKVKTTSPKRFLVKPNQDVLAPGSAVDVLILVQDGHQTSEQQEVLLSARDKFLIATCAVDDAMAGKLKQGVVPYQQLWDGNKEDQSSRRVPCSFLQTGSFTVAHTPVLSSTTSGPPPPVVVVVAPAAAVVAAPAPTPSSTNNNQQQQADFTYENLARAHKETIALLVQVTQERDLALKKLRDLQSSSSSSSSTTTTKPLSTTTGTFVAGATSTSTTGTGGFLLWHLLVVALVAVFLTRWLALPPPPPVY